MQRDPRTEDMEHSERVLSKRHEEAKKYKEKVRCFVKKYNTSYWEEGREWHERVLTEWHIKTGKPSGSIYYNDLDQLDMIFSNYKTIDYVNNLNGVIDANLNF
jgi:hypothetical protein